MRKRKSTDRNHVWQQQTHTVEVDGREQEAKSCSRCGMERTRDTSTATLYLFRDLGGDRWHAFKAGVIPACEKPEAP